MNRKMSFTARCGAVLLSVLLTYGGVMGGVYMRANIVQDRSRSVLTVVPSRGVDLTSSALDVDERRASEMVNLLPENGTLYKRPGWRQVAQLFSEGEDGVFRTGTVHGIWAMEADGERCLLAHVGTCFFRLTGSNSWEEVMVVGGYRPTDTRSYGFAQGGKLYIIGAGDYFVFGKSGSAWTVRRVTDGDVYIPVTTVGITDMGVEASGRTTLDPVNLLTVRRKNKLLGRALSDTVTELTWQLDGKPDRGSDVAVEIVTLGSDGLEVTYRLKSGNYKEVTMNGGQSLVSAMANLVPEDAQPGEDGQYASGVCVGSINYLSGRLTLWGAYADGSGDMVTSLAPAVEGVANITVVFNCTPEGGSERVVQSATCGILFGAGGVADRLFIGGVAGYPERVYYSGMGDMTYFPDTNFVSCGTAASPVTGFSRVSDGVLAVHKAGSGQEPTICYLSGETKTEYDESGSLSAAYEPFYVVAGQVDAPVVSAAACADFYGDPLILTREGVYAVVIRENITTAERYLVERSASIRKALRDADLSEACAAVYGGRYWLCVGGICYVAQADQTWRDAAGNVQYEWYILGNIPATVMAVLDGAFYFGTADGRICRMGDSGEGAVYYDQTSYTWQPGTVSVASATDSRLALSGDLLSDMDIVDGDILQFGSGLYEEVLDAGAFSVSGGRILPADPGDTDGVHEGDRLVADGVDSLSGLTIGGVYLVSDTDRADGSFRLLGEDGQAVVPVTADFRLLRDLSGLELTVTELDTEAATCKLSLRSGEPLRLTTMTFWPDMLTGRLIRRAPVSCAWYSRTFDLGSPLYEKTLHRLAVSYEPERCGPLSVGYRAKNSRALLSSGGYGSMQLAETDFSDFSFSTMAESHVRLLRTRHVNYIMLRYESGTATPCCIHSLSVVYTVTGEIRGGM